MLQRYLCFETVNLLHKEAVQILQCLAKLSFAFGGFYRAVSWCTAPQQLATYLQHHLQPDQDIVILIVIGFVSVFAFVFVFVSVFAFVFVFVFVFLGFYRAVSAPSVGNQSATPSPA